MALNPDWKEFVELLNSNDVEYLVVGAFALALHGLPRLTGDIDFYLNNTPENAQRVLQTLRAFGFGSLDITASDLTSEDRVVQLGHAPRRIDLLTFLSGLRFEEAWKNRETREIDGVKIPLISRRDFIDNKLATGRPKDLADADAMGSGEESTQDE